MPVDYRFGDLLKGYSINQLSQVFELDRRTVTTRLRALKHSGDRDGHKIYKLLEAAPLLLERYMYNEAGELVKNPKQKDESDKDYWDGQLKKQKFEENAGDLWRTEKVVMAVSEILKLFREAVTVFIDNLEYDSGLPAAQVASARIFGDNLLATCRQRVLELQADTLDTESPDTLDQGSDEDDFSDLGL